MFSFTARTLRCFRFSLQEVRVLILPTVTVPASHREEKNICSTYHLNSAVRISTFVYQESEWLTCISVLFAAGLSCSFPSPDTDHKSKTQSECSFFLVPAYLQQKTLPLSWPAAPVLYTCFTRSNNFFAVGTRKMAWMRYVNSLALVHCCQALSSDFIRVIASLSRKCNPGPNFQFYSASWD